MGWIRVWASLLFLAAPFTLIIFAQSGEHAKGLTPAPDALTPKPIVPGVSLLSEGCPTTSDVRGNLGPADRVTSNVSKDWLEDRWQAASDMGGTSIPGPHWLQINLKQSVQHITKVVIDYETAFADDYSIKCRSSSEQKWGELVVSSRKVDSQVVPQHVVYHCFGGRCC